MKKEADIQGEFFITDIFTLRIKQRLVEVKFNPRKGVRAPFRYLKWCYKKRTVHLRSPREM